MHQVLEDKSAAPAPMPDVGVICGLVAQPGAVACCNKAHQVRDQGRRQGGMSQPWWGGLDGEKPVPHHGILGNMVPRAMARMPKREQAQKVKHPLCSVLP